MLYTHILNLLSILLSKLIIIIMKRAKLFISWRKMRGKEKILQEIKFFSSPENLKLKKNCHKLDFFLLFFLQLLHDVIFFLSKKIK
jgi:hypothetical protein